MYFDKETEKNMRLAQKIADAGLSTKYLEWKTRPHVTLAVYNDIDVDRCAQLLEKFAKEYKAFEIQNYTVEFDDHYRCRDCVE